MANRRMLAKIEGIKPRVVIGNPDRFQPASDGSGMLVYVRDEELGSMINVGKQYLFELDGTPVT